MRRYLDKDYVAGLFLIILGVGYYRTADALPRSLISDRVGAAGFPKLLASALILFSGVLIIQAFWRQLARTADQAGEGGGKTLADFAHAAGMLSLGVGYLLIVSRVGYLLSIALLLGAALRYQKEPLSVRMFVTALLGGILFWCFFVFALDTPMPAGIWPALLGAR